MKSFWEINYAVVKTVWVVVASKGQAIGLHSEHLGERFDSLGTFTIRTVGDLYVT
jgi:hypothetical protein